HSPISDPMLVLLEVRLIPPATPTCVFVRVGPPFRHRLPLAAERLRSLAGPAARNAMSRKAVMPARLSATRGSSGASVRIGLLLLQELEDHLVARLGIVTKHPVLRAADDDLLPVLLRKQAHQFLFERLPERRAFLAGHQQRRRRNLPDGVPIDLG